MADISAIGFQSNSAMYEGSFEKGRQFLDTSAQPSEYLDDDIEPLLRVQEHLQGSEVGYKTAGVPHSEVEHKQESYAEDYTKEYAQLETSNDEQHVYEEDADVTAKFSNELQYGDSNIDFGSRNCANNDSDGMELPNFDQNFNEVAFSGLCSDSPYNAACDAIAIDPFDRSSQTQAGIPGLRSNLGLAPDEPALGSATDSVVSPEFQPYEYIKDDTRGDAKDYGLGAPRVLPASFSSLDYDEGRFPSFTDAHNGYYSDAEFPGSLSQSSKTPELNTWQQAALAQAYADATKAATFRTLIEASMYPQSPDLYDKLGRSLTGASNLEHHPIYGIYRSVQSSESPPSIFNTPNLSGVLNSPTFQPPTRGMNVSAPRGRAKKSAPEFETKLLPRPSFASSDPSGGSFMMVNLRVKKGAQKKKGSSHGVSKRRSSGSRPRHLHEQSDSWRLGGLES